MHVLVVHAHPLGESFSSALRAEVVAALKAGGHTVDLCDLYAEGFDPVLSSDGRAAYHDTAANTAGLETHVERLRRAEGVVLVFPTWWYGMPAILKGYFDRVWLPGVAFTLPETSVGAIAPLLTNLRLFGVVTTTGAPWWFTRLYMGDPSRKVLMRGFSRLLPHPRVERFWLVLHGMDKSTAERRAGFLARVRHRLAAVR